VRTSHYDHALYEYELRFEALDSKSRFPGAGYRSLQTLLEFYLARRGSWGTFLYVDPTDYIADVPSARLGNGFWTDLEVWRFANGSSGYVQPVSWVTSIQDVFLGGVAQPSGWSFVEPNIIRFDTPPANGVYAGYTAEYAWECRFLDDALDFENFQDGLWSCESLKFRTVR